MANGMREVAQPLEQGDAGTVKLTAPDEDEDESGDDAGGEEGSGETEQPARQVAGKGANGQRPKAGGRAERRDIWRANQDLKSTIERQTGQIQQLQQTFQAQIAEIRREATAGRTPAAAQGAPAAAGPNADKIKTLSQARASELQALSSHNEARLANPKLGNYDLTRYYEIQDQLDEAKSEAAIEKWLRARGVDPDKRGAPQQQVNPNAIAQQVAYSQIRDVITSEFPWVSVAGPDGDRYRKALIRQIEYLTEAKQMPDTLPTHRQAASMVERDLQLAPARRAAPRPRRDFVDISDENRASNGGPREVSIPSEMLENTGLSMDKLRKAVFRGRGE